MKAVACRNLRAGYGGTHVFENASFHVGEGVTCLIGKNGAGKTTLFRILAGIIPPDSGTVELFGRDPFVDRDVKRYVGYLAHRPSLYSGLTAEQNLQFWAKANGLDWRAIAGRVAKLVESFALGPLLAKRAGALSRGQQQRVAIARMMLGNPRLVLMDEPSTGLDAVATHELHQLVDRIQREGASVLYATHSLPEATELGDEFLLIANKDIVCLGNRDSLRGASRGLTVRLRLTGNPEPVLSRLGIPYVRQGESIQVTVDGNETLNEVIAELLRNGSTLLEMRDAVSVSQALLDRLQSPD